MVIEVAVVALVDADLGEAVVMAEEVAAVMVVEALVAEAEEALVDTVAVDHREFYLHIAHLMLNFTVVLTIVMVHQSKLAIGCSSQICPLAVLGRY